MSLMTIKKMYEVSKNKINVLFRVKSFLLFNDYAKLAYIFSTVFEVKLCIGECARL